MDAMAASPLPTSFVDRGGVYRFVNRAYERWFGLSADDVVGKSLEEVLGPKAVAALEFYTKAALDGGTVEFESSLPYRTRGVRRMKIVYAAAREPTGEIPGFFAFLEDITVRYDAESAVATALDGMADGYFALDRQLRFTYVNSAAARLYGLPREKMLEKTLDEVFPGSSGAPTGLLAREVMRSGNPQRRELPSAGRPGQTFLFDVIPLMSGGVGVVAQDLTERRRQEAELKLANARFEAAARASHGVVYEWDPATNAVWRAGAFEDVFGVSAEAAEPTVEWWTSRMHPDDLIDPQSYVVDFDEVTERTYRILHADGGWRRVLDRATAVRGDAGEIARVVGMVIALPDEPSA